MPVRKPIILSLANTERKIMKKLFTAAALIGSLFLVGCNETTDNTDNDLLLNALPAMSKTEKDMLDHLTQSAYLSYHNDTYAEIIRTRITFGRDVTPRPDELVPFCDVIGTVNADEKSRDVVGRHFTLNSQWFEKYGITLTTQCNQIQYDKEQIEQARQRMIEQAKADELEVSNSVVSKEAVRVEKILEDTVIIKDEAVLSPELVRELRQSVTDCNRAKIKLIGIVDSGETLTTTHYDDVQSLVLQCEMHQLEVELNK
ncbi:hypothetical protein VPHD480_0327 [Vibrio phage D480]